MTLLQRIPGTKILIGAAHARFLREEGGLSFISNFLDQDPRSPVENKQGYQRPPTSTRFPKIAAYYKANDHGNRITPLVISVRMSDESEEELSEFIRLFESQEVDQIHEQFGRDVFCIMDGQHRLKGLERAADEDESFDPLVPVVCYVGLSYPEEVNMFNTINGTQKNLPRSLIEISKTDVTEASKGDYKQQIRLVASALCRDEDSVWGPVDGELQVNLSGVRDPNKAVTFEGIRRSTAQMFPKELINRLSGAEQTPEELAKRYWRAVSEACQDPWNGEPSSKIVYDEGEGKTETVNLTYRIRELVGVAALSRLGRDIIQEQISSQDPTRIETMVKKLAIVDWLKDRTNGWMFFAGQQSGFAGQKVLYEILYNVVFCDEAEPKTFEQRW